MKANPPISGHELMREGYMWRGYMDRAHKAELRGQK